MRPARTSSMPGWYSAAPGVGKGDPVEVVAEARQDALGLAGDRGAPIDQGAEHVEEQGADAEDGGFYDHEGAPGKAPACRPANLG